MTYDRTILSFLFLAIVAARPIPDGQPHVFHYQGSKFMLDGKQFQLIGGEIHYARIPIEYWRHRIQMVKALGCNALSVYIFWNYHSPFPGVYDFTTENKNLKLFLQIAQEEGMWVLIRPGPYVCGEWDAGGHPWWLMKNQSTALRSTSSTAYLEAVSDYIKNVIPIIAPRQVTRGGNIIMLQIENEYGYVPKDKNWMKALLSMWQITGQIEVPYYHADPSSGIKDVHLPNLAIGINPGIQESYFAEARSIDPTVPIMSSETWLGWMTHWGESWSGQTVPESVRQVTFLLEHNYPFSIYMAHGGTNFGFWAGANFDESLLKYAADITSYDYDAAINEMGQRTERFDALRELIQTHVAWPIPDPPAAIPSIQIPPFKPEQFGTIWDNLKFGTPSVVPLTIENLDQAFGLIAYKAQLDQLTANDILSFDDIHDVAWVYLNNDFIGTLDRRFSAAGFYLIVPQNYQNVELTVLVEAMGRINFDQRIFDQKGIVGNANLNGKPIENWNHASIPLDEEYLSNLREAPVTDKTHGVFFNGQFVLENLGDTYFDMSKWKKGVLWVNGRNLGRYWSIGPQQRLYCPGVWLKQGVNKFVVLDLELSEAQEISGEKAFK